MKIEKPVFIFCMHRSGSTYLKNMIEASREVKMLDDEVHFDHPFFLKTFKRYYTIYCNDNFSKYQIFLDTISRVKLRGTFWQYYTDKYKNFNNSKRFLDGSSTVTVWDSFNSILNQILADSGKIRVGIKYPAHHKYYQIFRKQYQDSKNIFLVRDPRAIIASKILSPTNKRLKNKGKLKYEAMRLMTVLYFIIEFRSFAKTISNNKKDTYVIKYENLVMSRDRLLRELCDFTEIKLRTDMLSANGKDSGYGGSPTPKNRIDRWATILRRYEKILINYFTEKSRKSMDYD